MHWRPWTGISTQPSQIKHLEEDLLGPRRKIRQARQSVTRALAQSRPARVPFWILMDYEKDA